MEISLTIKCTPFEPQQASDCRVLLDALNYYKYNVLTSTEDYRQQCAIDTLLNKVTLALMGTVELLPVTVEEDRGV